MTVKFTFASPTQYDASPPILKSRAPRSFVMLSATVEYFDGREMTKHRVRDLSTGGIRIDGASQMRVGATVLISVGLLEAVGASVQWVADDCAGLAFAETIDPNLARTRQGAAPSLGAASTGSHSLPPGPTAGYFANARNPYRK